MACHHHANLSQTSSKTAPHLVQELALDATKLPMPSPSTRPLPPGRNRRCTAGRHNVEHLACTIKAGRPGPTSAHPSRPRPPRRVPRHPRPAATAPVPPQPLHVATQARCTLPAAAPSHPSPIRGHGPSPAPSPCHLHPHTTSHPPPARSTSPSSSAGEEREMSISVPRACAKDCR